jgi:hypothetical protein
LDWCASSNFDDYENRRKEWTHYKHLRNWLNI